MAEVDAAIADLGESVAEVSASIGAERGDTPIVV